MSEEKKIKVLLAEDEEFISRAYKDGFERAGFEVITAFDGEEAVIKTRENKPDVMLLDLVMPVKTGFEVLRELRADKNFADMPILVLSNLSQESDIEESKKLGATDFLVKSNMTLQEVIAKIKQYAPPDN